MPLWGRKLYQARHNETDVKLKGLKFTIPFTGEVFCSEKEYKEQLALYKQPLWTCQSSGDSGLNYEEASRSEARHKKIIDEHIPRSMQKAVLQFIHHNSGTLDSLVEKVEDHFENNFHVGELVELAKSKGKIIKGKILQVKSVVEGCNGSPSSDKENHGVEPELLRQTKSGKATVRVYNIQIGGKSGKVISSIPAEDLIRCDDLPPPYLIKLLIRSNALQAGTKSTSPWVVSPDVVKALDIRNKLIETMLPSTRISIRGLKGATKRKPAVTTLGGTPSKKPRLENGCGPTSPNGPRTPTRTSVAVSDDEDEPSPEKVYLDHSYSSPKSKKSKPPARSPKDEVKSPPSSSSSSSSSRDGAKVARKQSTLETFSAKKGLKQPVKDPKNTSRSPKVKSDPEASKKKTPQKKTTAPVRAKSEEKEINVVTYTTSEDSSSSDDSDIVLKDLHVKLSPIKDKLQGMARRTLADHFLSLSSKKASQEGQKGKGACRVSTNKNAAGKAVVSPRKETKVKDQQKVKGDKKPVTKSISRTKVEPKLVEISSGSSDSESSDSDSSIKEVPVDSKNAKGSSRKILQAKKSSQKTQKPSAAATKVVKKKSGKTIQKPASKSNKSDSAPLSALAKALCKSPSKTSPKKGPTTPKKSTSKVTKKTVQSPSKSSKASPRKTLSQLAIELNKKKTSKSPEKLAKKSPAKNKSPLKNAVTKKSPTKAPAAGNKTPVKKKVSPTKTPKSKSLKQSTLFKFSSAKKRSQAEGNNSDDDALILYKLAKPQTPVTPREPPIALKIMRAKRMNNRALYTRLVGQAARLLSKKQIQTLKPLIQGDVMARALAIEAKLKWDKMTPEERQKEIEAKKRERTKKREAERAKRRLAEKEKLKRYEDQLLDLKPLLVPKPVPLPEGLPNTLFGDIAMVIEFLNCYSDFLMPNDPYPVTADSFMKALVCDKEGFAYLSRMLVILLKTLLQDQITEEFAEIGMKLSDIPVNMHTASELLRLSLLQTDTDVDDRNDDDSDASSVSQEEGEFTAPQDLVELLETSEFYSLAPEVKLELMVCVCNRILSTYSLVDYMEDKQRKAAKLWVQKMQTLKEKNNQLKEEKKKQREEREAAQKLKKEAEEKEEANKGDKDKKPAAKKTKKEAPKVEAPPPPAPVEEPEDLASVVKRRRILTARAKQEQEEQAKKDLERRQKEQEELRIQREKQTFEKNFEEGIRLAKLALRHQPIGTDRNHNRYWVFSSVTPGLFVEKGWVTQDIEYSTAPSTNDDDDNADDKKMVHGLEKSFPKEGQNLWFQYETTKELDSLLECLDNAGIRDSALHGELKKRYNDISKLLFQTRRSGPQLRDSDGDKELLDSFKEDLKDIETHITQGNLGGVPNYEKWEKKVDAAKTLKDFVPLLLQSQSCVSGKFLESIMSPPKAKDGVEPKEGEVTEKVLKWREAVKNCMTMSRLHVLMSIFEVSVKWEKSSQNAKCKICRKKGDTNQIILCDECNQPFHLLCLRPALNDAPKEWKCPSCAPMQQRPGRKRNYKELAGSGSEEEESDEESEEEDSDSEEEPDPDCCVCGNGEETVICCQCRSAYHKDCHQPPMRNLPRQEWTCSDCRHGRSRKKGAAKKGKKGGRTSRRR